MRSCLMALILAWLPAWPFAAAAAEAQALRASATLPAPHDLAREARGAGPPQAGGSPRGGQRSVGANTPGAANPLPLLILFSRADCPWCERARRGWLLPMHTEPAWQGRVALREVWLDSDAAMTDFSGRATTQRAFAAAQGVRVTPTVMLFGPGGERLAEPIVGLRIADFYGAYLERAVEEAGMKLGRRAP
ncbi:MAG: hypothetical protein HY778_06480 [Betaproteobacteria bacterium]|nr:hypothetical protein [Betaproteobacteria bacterium]